MIRKAAAGLLSFYWEFIKLRPRLSIVFLLVMFAACAGGIYLLIARAPIYVNFPCFPGCPSAVSPE